MSTDNTNTRQLDIGTDILAFSVGRRKRSVARVRMYRGSGKIFFNGKLLEEVGFTKPQLIEFNKPIILSNFNNDYDFSIKAVGGGVTGQLMAARLGVARCIAKVNDDLRKLMRKNGFLTRDPREKERKKIYHVGARKSPQFSKR